MKDDEFKNSSVCQSFKQSGGSGDNNTFGRWGVGFNIPYDSNSNFGFFIKGSSGEIASYTSTSGTLNIFNIYSTANTIQDHNGAIKIGGAEELSDCKVGIPLPWPQATAPAGYLMCNGQSFNKTQYPLLAKAYPDGKLPDLRSEFIRGLSAGRDIDNGRAVLSAQGDAMRPITGGNIRVWASSDSSQPSGAFEGITSNRASPGEGGTSLLETTFDSSRVVPTANETRPRNIAFLYIVRAA
ncbi:phage tail protein [Providencia rettgeri]|nr:phage tail protein [Providencia rettgeri]